MRSPEKHKVLVIGLDAATFAIIDPLIEKGRLPNIGHFLRHGARGNLRTTIPPLSPNAWTSFATGKNAGKHGIFSFTEPKTSDYGIRFVNAKSRKAQPIWSILSEAGKKVGVINMPVSFPPDEVDGFMISGMDTPGRRSDFTYPADLRKTILEKFDYEVDYSFLGSDLEKKGKIILDNLYEIERKRVDTARYLMDLYDWDFLFIVLVALDRVQHFFWHCMEPFHSRYGEKGADRYRNAVFDMYERMDGLVGRLCEGLDGKTSIILMSDHGAGPFENAVPYLNLNNWLYDRGYLRLKKREKNWMNVMIRLREFLRQSLASGTREWLKTLFPGIRESFQSHVYFSAIQWSETKAYAAYDEFMARGIRVNLKGREPGGVVEPGEDYERIRNILIDEISRIKHPLTHEPVVYGVYRREDLYRGEYIHKAPDLVIEWNEKAFFTGKNLKGMESSAEKDRFKLTDILRSGDHRPYGIFIASGPFISKAKTISGADIMDLAPTILYMMNQPVPEDMDGHALFQIFDDSYIKNNPVRYQKQSGFVTEEVSETYSAKEAKKIEKRLKKLGYLD